MKRSIKNLLFDSNKGKIKLNERASIFFFCFLLSTFFWFLSSLSKDYTTTLSIPLSYNSDSEKFILMDAPKKSVEIQVSANGFELLGEQMSLNRTEIQVDLDKAYMFGKNDHAIAASSLKNDILESLDKDLNFDQIITDSLYFSTQIRVKKKLRIIPLTDFSFNSGFNLIGDIIVEPSELMIYGPSSVIDTMTFIPTEKLIKENIDDSLRISYDFEENENYKGLKIVPSQIEIIVPVEKFTEKVFDLELSINSSKSGINVRTFPNKVKTVFLVPLSKYSVFNESSVQARVSIGNDDLTKKKLAVEVIGIPKYAKLLRVEPEKVEFIIKE